MTTELPYAGTEGFVGRPASAERARRNAQDGTSNDRQHRVLRYLEEHPGGLTWVELGEVLRLHHGQVSSTLSVLHQAGKVFQLRLKRGRSHPYVHAQHRYLYIADERYDQPTRTNASLLQSRIDTAEAVLEVALDQGESRGAPIAEPEARLIRAALNALRGEDA